MYSLEALLTALEAGADPHYLFFWGHRPPKRGVSKACFSQWYAAGFELERQEYSTAEHYMMAEKARLFGDEERLGEILSAETPAEAKKLGRLVADFDQARWQAARYEIVLAGNLAKFAQNAALKHFLLGTGAQVIVEASPYDKIWGIGLSANDPKAQDPRQWDGLNLLGFALMEVRDKLRESG